MHDVRKVDFTTSIQLHKGAHFQVPTADMHWMIYERYLELERPPPPLACMRLVDATGQELIGWAPLIAISFVREEGLLVRRLERLEAALAHELRLVRPLGSLRCRLELPAGAEFWPEFMHCLLDSQEPSGISGQLHVSGIYLTAR